MRGKLIIFLLIIFSGYIYLQLEVTGDTIYEILDNIVNVVISELWLMIKQPLVFITLFLSIFILNNYEKIHIMIKTIQAGDFKIEFNSPGNFEFNKDSVTRADSEALEYKEDESRKEEIQKFGIPHIALVNNLSEEDIEIYINRLDRGLINVIVYLLGEPRPLLDVFRFIKSNYDREDIYTGHDEKSTITNEMGWFYVSGMAGMNGIIYLGFIDKKSKIFHIYSDYQVVKFIEKRIGIKVDRYYQTLDKYLELLEE